MTHQKVQGLEAKSGLFSLKTGPWPTPLDAPLHTEQDIAQHRRLYCGHYTECLDESVHKRWLCFSCTQCPMRDLAVAGPTSELFAHQRRTERSNNAT